MRKNIVILAIVVLALGVPACTVTPTTPTGPQLSSSATNIIAGSLVPGDTKTEFLTIPGGQLIRITLTTLNTTAGLPMGGSVTLKFGVSASAGTVCNALQSATVSAQLTTHFKATISQGDYCLEVTDTAGLPEPANYTLRVVFGTPASLDPAATIVFENAVALNGFTARNFIAGADGQVTLVLDEMIPASVTALGIAIGHPRATGTGCEASVVRVPAPRGATLTVPVDAGGYCAKVFDPGTLTGTAAFSLRIVRP